MDDKNKSNSYEIRKIVEADIPIIVNLFYDETGVKLNPQVISEYIANFPSLVVLKDFLLIGFIYSKEFSPDINEIDNIFIKINFRGKGLGTKMLNNFKLIAKNNFKAVILSNSKLYKYRYKKQLATNFYLKNSFKIIYTTKDTHVYVFELR